MPWGPLCIRGSNTCMNINKLPTKLPTTIKKINFVSNTKNSELISKFHEFMKSNGESERHHNNNLKADISFANFLGEKINSPMLVE